MGEVKHKPRLLYLEVIPKSDKIIVMNEWQGDPNELDTA